MNKVPGTIPSSGPKSLNKTNEISFLMALRFQWSAILKGPYHVYKFASHVSLTLWI